MRVLVTGGAGYIGSVILEELLAHGDTVIAYDSLVKGHRDAVSAGAELVEGDVLDGARLTATLRDRRIEAVIHMAADSLVGESVSDPAKYYRNNVVGGLTLLDAMRAADVPWLVFSSTAAVYGAPGKQPIDEDEPPAPTNPYGETKLAFERALAWYADATPLRAISLRYFNAAGASEQNGEQHDPETHLIPLVLQAAAGVRPHETICGDDYDTPDGTCVRDYIHVQDLARAHRRALQALARGAPGGSYNLGNGDGFSVREVIDVASRVSGRSIPVQVGPRRAGDPARLVASCARAAAALGWRPERPELADIVASVWRWMRTREGKGSL